MQTDPISDPPWRRNILPYKQRFQSPLELQFGGEQSQSHSVLSLSLIQRGETASCVWDARYVRYHIGVVFIGKRNYKKSKN